VTLAYPAEMVRSEVVFIAYHLHWSLGELLELPHSERVAWVGQVSAMNKKVLSQK